MSVILYVDNRKVKHLHRGKLNGGLKQEDRKNNYIFLRSHKILNFSSKHFILKAICQSVAGI